MFPLFVAEQALAGLIAAAQRMIQHRGSQLACGRLVPDVEALLGIQNGVTRGDVVSQQFRAKFAFGCKTLGHASIMQAGCALGKA